MKNNLIGLWKLNSFEFVNNKGNIIYPYGENPIGSLVYTNDGYMSVNIMSRNREKCNAENMSLASNDEKSRAVETYFSYCGKYEIQGDLVLHHIEISLFPNWVGTTQKRKIREEDNKLILFRDGIKIFQIDHTVKLIWERIS